MFANTHGPQHLLSRITNFHSAAATGHRHPTFDNMNPHIDPLPFEGWRELFTSTEAGFASLRDHIVRRLPLHRQLLLRLTCRGINFTVWNRDRDIALTLRQLKILANSGVQCHRVKLMPFADGRMPLNHAFFHEYTHTSSLSFDTSRLAEDILPPATTNFVKGMLVTWKMFPNLRRLELHGVRMRSDLDLRGLELLTTLLLEGTSSPNNVHHPCQLNACVPAHQLEKLGLVRSGLQLSSPGAFTSLKWLNLKGYDQWPDEGDLNWLTALGPKLITLKLCRCRGLHALGGLELFEMLESLDVRENFNDHHRGDLLGAVTQITVCRDRHRRLRHIRMQGCDG